jgi:hypothetical protein
LKLRAVLTPNGDPQFQTVCSGTFSNRLAHLDVPKEKPGALSSTGFVVSNLLDAHKQNGDRAKNSLTSLLVWQI